jgi:sugar/nucleoside kinase (ribokinase family)
VSFDPNWDPEERWEGVRELLPFTSVFLPNETEALAISGAADAVAAGRALSSLGPLVVIKRGEKGSLAVRGDRVWEFTPAATVAVVDAVGAGDNFDAGFICAWLSGMSVEDGLRLGHRCAASSLACAGGIGGQLRERCFRAAVEVRG